MKNSIIYGVFVFIIAFVIYTFTANPAVTFTDNGELAGAILSNGVAHPTGYPLFLIIGYFWSLIPTGLSQIYQLNLFAAFFTALSVFIFYLHSLKIISYTNAVKSESHKIVLSIIFSSTYLFASTIWTQANSLEVYSLQIFMFNMIIFSLLNIKNSLKPDKWLILTAFITGLSFSNHMTTILILPGIIYFYFTVSNNNSNFLKNRFKSLLILFVPFLLGLSLYLYLPVISITEPAFNWGAVHRNLDKFLYHIQGKQYQIWMFSGAETIQKNLGIFFNSIPNEISYPGIILLLVGIFAGFKYNKKLNLFLIVLLFSCIIYSVNYSIHDIQAYFSLAYISMILISLFGGIYLYKKQNKIIFLYIIIPLYLLIFNYQDNNRSEDYLVDSYTEYLVNNLDSNAVIISAQWDYWCSSFWYKQYEENFRNDVKLVEKELLRRTWYPLQLRNWYPELCEKCNNQLSLFEVQLELFESEKNYNPLQIQKRFENLLICFIESNIDKYPVYITLDILQTERNLLKNYKLIPDGFALRVYRLNNKNIQPDADFSGLDKFISSAKRYSENHLEKGIADAAAINFVNAARYSLSINNIDLAKRYLEFALKFNPNNQMAIQLNTQINRN